jgi:hypothetical protein
LPETPLEIEFQVGGKALVKATVYRIVLFIALSLCIQPLLAEELSEEDAIRLMRYGDSKALAAAAIPEGTNLKSIIDKPAVLTASVSSIMEDGKPWLPILAEVHMVTSVPLSKLKAVVTDYDNYTNIFRNITESHTSGNIAGHPLAHFVVTVGALGMKVVTDYSVLFSMPINEKDKCLIVFTHYSDNGSIRKILGWWYFESIMIDQKIYTYIRYHSSQNSYRFYPLEKTCLSLFMKGQYRDMPRQCAIAARRY